MTNQWYCKIMGEEWGPMSATELIAVARWGRLTRDDPVRRGDDGTWVRAELVRGLFNTAPVAATVTSERLIAAVRKAAPAKRSLRKLRTPYWVHTGKKIIGPFTSRKLKLMAERGALRRSHLISRDRRRWAAAAQVKGLSFTPAEADEATLSARSAGWMDQPHAPNAPTASFSPAEPGGVLAEAER